LSRGVRAKKQNPGISSKVEQLSAEPIPKGGGERVGGGKFFGPRRVGGPKLEKERVASKLPLWVSRILGKARTKKHSVQSVGGKKRAYVEDRDGWEKKRGVSGGKRGHDCKKRTACLGKPDGRKKKMEPGGEYKIGQGLSLEKGGTGWHKGRLLRGTGNARSGERIKNHTVCWEAPKVRFQEDREGEEGKSVGEGKKGVKDSLSRRLNHGPG